MYTNRLENKQEPLYSTLRGDFGERMEDGRKDFIMTPEVAHGIRFSFASVAKFQAGLMASLIFLKVSTWKLLRRYLARIESDIEQLSQQLKCCKSIADVWSRIRSFAVKLFWRAYPFIRALHAIWSFACKVLYLINVERWPYWTPSLRLQHLILRSVD